MVCHPSPIQTVTVGSGFSPDQPRYVRTWFAGLACAGLTAGREFRPAPKVYILLLLPKIDYTEPLLPVNIPMLKQGFSVRNWTIVAAKSFLRSSVTCKTRL